MPEEGAPLSPKEHLLTADEVVKLASIFVSNGVRKIRLTGGEPTVRKDLPEIVGMSFVSLHITTTPRACLTDYFVAKQSVYRHWACSL